MANGLDHPQMLKQYRWWGGMQRINYWMLTKNLSKRIPHILLY